MRVERTKVPSQGTSRVRRTGNKPTVKLAVGPSGYVL